MHFPELAPHAPLRQIAPPLPVVHVPSPSARPHLLSVSQTPPAHSAVPTDALHTPSPWRGSGVDNVVPLASFARHVSVAPLQNCAALQSPSTSQPAPPLGTHLPDDAPHAPLRHTVAPFPALHVPSPTMRPHFRSEPHAPLRHTAVVPLEHVPSPFANPHLLSASHAPLAHSAMPTAPLQIPPLCGTSFTSVAPLASFAVQVSVAPLQNCAAEQSPSTMQPLPPEGTHTSETVPQVALRQTVAAVPLVQVPSPFANPHLLSVSQTPPVHSASPTATEQVPSLWSVSGLTSAVLFASLPTQRSVEPLQNWPLAQSASAAHPEPPAGTHLFELVAHAPLAHSAVPTPTVQIPLLWRGSGTTSCAPSASFAAQVSVVPLQKLPAAQSLSAAHPLLAGTHLLDDVPHAPLTHSAVPTATEHVPLL